MQTNFKLEYLKDLIKYIIDRQHFNFSHVFSNRQCSKYLLEQLDQLKTLSNLPVNAIYKLYTNMQSQIANDVYFDTEHLNMIIKILKNIKCTSIQSDMHTLYHSIIDNIK